MKRVFSSNLDCINAWAERATPDGRTRTGTVFFKGDTIYSYGHHFALARFYEKNGRVIVLVNGRRYSNSTSKQQGRVRGAIFRSGFESIDVPDPENTREDCNAAWHEARLVEAQGKYVRARLPGRKQSYKAQIEALVFDFNTLAEFFRYATRLTVPA